MDVRHSPNHDARPDATPIDMLVLHYTGMRSCDEALERMCDPASKVGAHYLIDDDGRITELVPEDRRAWHAGEAFWRGSTDINARSIGIELVNPGHEFGLTPFPDAQMASVEKLALKVVHNYVISQPNIVGHSDIAPRRKCDPGELFDWPRLAAAGIGVWPEGATPTAPDLLDCTALLADMGYETVDMEKTVAAFQRRYRISLIDGKLDAETAGLLARLSELSNTK